MKKMNKKQLTQKRRAVKAKKIRKDFEKKRNMAKYGLKPGPLKSGPKIYYPLSKKFNKNDEDRD